MVVEEDPSNVDDDAFRETGCVFRIDLTGASFSPTLSGAPILGAFLATNVIVRIIALKPLKGDIIDIRYNLVAATLYR